VAVDASDDLTLMVPLSGWSTAVIEGRKTRWIAGRSAMYVPGTPRLGESGMRSTLAIGLEKARLERAACCMTGTADEAAIRSILAAPQVLPLVRGGYSFASVLRPLCGLIDSCLDQPDQLRLLGIDDTIYRAVAMLLLPESILVGNASAATPAGRRPVDRACDHILAHLFAPLRLEDLEAASGLKARALQLAFMKRFGRTPRQWILDRRLDAARARLTEPGVCRTVTAVALECGFTRMSSFSLAYERRFGELPRTTITNRPPA
jgi:AraC-like DNA-binding protein